MLEVSVMYRNEDWSSQGDVAGVTKLPEAFRLAVVAAIAKIEPVRALSNPSAPVSACWMAFLLNLI
jgi:hypothetical protein